MDTKRDKKSLIRIRHTVRSGPGVNVSEFHWPNADDSARDDDEFPGLDRKADEKRPTDVEQLVGALKNAPTVVQSRIGDLKKQLNVARQRQPKPLPPPLQDRAREKIERVEAYRHAKGDLNDWDEIVKKNRLTDHLNFPLNQRPIRPKTVEDQTAQFEPRTELEIRTAQILAGSKNHLSNDQCFTLAEKEAFMNMTKEEASERRAKLLKTRALISYAERKVRWRNRIKSKRYRRLLKHQERKVAEKEFQRLLEEDPAAAMEKLEMLERDRIKERMTLKHRSTGKWAKQIRHLSKKDPRLREALQDQLRLGRELAEKKRNMDTDGDDQDTDDPQEDDDEIIETDAEENGEKETGKKSKKQQWVDTKTILQATPRLVTANDEASSDGSAKDANEDLMAEAFAEDDVIDEFKNDLAADIDKEDAEAVSNLQAELTLPGWNSWTGPGTEQLPSNQRRRKRVEGLKAEREAKKKRRLDKWPLVKLDEKAANESVRKFQVSDLPFPFSSARNFEAHLGPPVGKEWNPETTHRQLIRPAVQTRMGAVIQPMSREAVLKKKKQKSTPGMGAEVKGRGRRNRGQKKKRGADEPKINVSTDEAIG